MNICNSRVLCLMLAIVIFGSASHISLPLVVVAYPSVLFVIIICSVEGLIIYGIFRFVYGGMGFINLLKHDLALFIIHYKTIIATGVSNTFMTMLMMYSANPTRTPVLIQSVFLGLAIISSIFFSKIFLYRKAIYNYPYAILSILYLMGSVAIAIVPLATSPAFKREIFKVEWIFMFMFGVFMYSLTNILQEKFICDVNNNENVISNNNIFNTKAFIAFYSSIFQFISIILFSWIDIFLGYEIENKTQFELFIQGFTTMFTNANSCILLQIFVLLWFLLFVLALFLNEISTNYTMILTNITNQSVALFFIIFPQFNNGIKYPLFITLSSLATSLISVLFWIKAEVIVDNITIEEENMNSIK